MTLLWSDTAVTALQQFRQEPGGAAYDRLVTKLVALENHTLLFLETESVVVINDAPAIAGTADLLAHVMEADPGEVFVISFRLADDDTDVWIVGLHHGR